MNKKHYVIFVLELKVFCDKIAITEGPALSLDINQPAADPAALAIAILSSAKSSSSARGNPQVPLVIISQPVAGPSTSQTSFTHQPLLGASSAATIQTEVLTETEVSLSPDECTGSVSHTSPDLTSFPVAIEQPLPEPPSATAMEVTSPETEKVLVVSVIIYKFL